jgi:hypothetical protein
MKTMNQGPDLTVLSSTGEPQLSVEVRAQPNSSESNADAFRRNLVAYSVIPSSTSFLLAMADWIYLWPDHSGDSPEVFRLETRKAIQPLLGERDPAGLGGSSLALAVRSWLAETINAPVNADSDSMRFFRDAGVLDRIRGGRIRVNPDP